MLQEKINKKSILALSKVIFIKILITLFSVFFSMFCLLFPIKLYLNDSVCVQMSMGHDQKWYGLPSMSSQMNRIDRDSVWVCQRVSEQLSKVRFHGLESCLMIVFDCSSDIFIWFMKLWSYEWSYEWKWKKSFSFKTLFFFIFWK